MIRVINRVIEKEVFRGNRSDQQADQIVRSGGLECDQNGFEMGAQRRTDRSDRRSDQCEKKVIGMIC